jgi:hypothetical protein
MIMTAMMSMVKSIKVLETTRTPMGMDISDSDAQIIVANCMPRAEQAVTTVLSYFLTL